MKRELADGTIVDFTPEEIAEYEAELAAKLLDEQQNGYKKKRKAAYMPLEDQLDMLYHDMKEGTDTFVRHRDEVKNMFPKPTQ